MAKTLILVIFGLHLIYEGSFAQEQFIQTPDKNSYTEVGSEFLFNWTYAGIGARAKIIQWYQNDAAGKQKSPIIMDLIISSLTVYHPSFIGRVSYVTNAAMLVKNISFSDEGYYSCYISYYSGHSDRNTIFLHVTIAPTLGLHLPNTTIVFINTKASWSCQFDARPIPTVKWYFNGQEINNPRYSINTTSLGVFSNATRVLSTLTINSTEPEDTGNIKCTAILPNSNISTSTNNIVYYSPRHTSFSSNILNVGDLGKATTFTCSAKGDPQLSYQIYKDGNLLTNTTTGIHVINSTKFNDSGLYSCVPVNYLGEGPRVDYNFSVYVSPNLQSQSAAYIETSVGSSVTIHCAFSGSPAPTVTWKKLVGNLSSAVNITNVITTLNGSYPVVNSTMRFDKIEALDHGAYECIAENPAGSPSAKISINVTYPPQFSKNLNANYTLSEDRNKSAKWTCIATGNPIATMTWRINGGSPGVGYEVTEKTVPLFNGFQVESTLTMVSIIRNKSSEIVCNASNSLGSIQSVSNVIINYHPSTSRPMESLLNKTAGQPILLSCEIDSQPRSDILWEKDGTSFNSPFISTSVMESNIYMTKLQSNLSISSVNKSDEGLYTCVAVNSVGNLTQSAYIHVNYAPEFLKALQMTSIVLDGTATYTMECIVRSKPRSSITWTKNGTVIQNSNKTMIQSVYINETIKGITLKSSMTINKIEKQDYGNYICTAENSVGPVKSEQLLVISYQPFVIASSAQTVYANATQNITLHCDFQSSPSAVSITWKSNNQRITSPNHVLSNSTIMTSSQHTQQRSALTVTLASRYDSAVYECEADNGIGRDKKNMTLVVYYAPLITESMSGKYIKEEGTTLNLTCKFTSNPAPIIGWTLNSSAILNSANGYNVSSSEDTQIYRVLSNATLYMANLQRTMQGYYACTAENHQGFAQKVTTVIVHYGPTFQSQSLTREVDTGNNITITCQVISNPVSNITWFKDGRLLLNNSDAVISTAVTTLDQFQAIVRSTLQLQVPNKNVTGNYSCQATRDTIVKRQETMVIARYAPVLTYNFTAQRNITESPSVVSFTCTAESHPASVILWYKDGSPYTRNIRNAVKVSEITKTIIESSLVFPGGIKRKDYGRYSCNATNSLGNASFSTDITVFYGPVFQSNLTGQVDITESKNTSFKCVVEGFPEPLVLWRKDGAIIQSGKHTIETLKTIASENMVVKTSYLNFTNVIDNDTATYTCEAKIVGTLQQTQILNVQYSPKLLVASSNITVNQSNPVSFHCQTKANPSVSRFNWTKGIQLPESGPIYSIQSTEFSSTGVYSCVAENAIGSSPRLLFRLTVNIPPTFTKQADCNPNITQSKMICECAGTGVPTPSVFWTKGTSSVIIGTGNVYEKSLAASDVDGKYICHLKNLLQEITSSSGFYYNLKPFTDWSQWGDCNATCGGGYQIRTRGCNFPPCDNKDLIAYRNCTGPCAPEQLKKDEVWALVLYILIPIVVVLILILLLWFARTNRRKEDDMPLVVPVYGNLSKPPSTRSMPTNRNIYLPASNFGTVNSAYLVDAETPNRGDAETLKNEDVETPKKEDMFIAIDEGDYENVEAEIRFDDEDYPKDSSTDEDVKKRLQSPSPTTNDEYLEILPSEDSVNAVDVVATDASNSYPNYAFEDECVTSL